MYIKRKVAKLHLTKKVIQCLATVALFLLLCQNVKITGVSAVEPEELRMATAVIVIAVSALDGSVSRGLAAPEWQHHVHLTKGVVPIIAAG